MAGRRTLPTMKRAPAGAVFISADRELRWVRGMRVTTMRQEPMLNNKCWICGEAATSGEHKTKRSDLRSVFGIPTQSSPLYLHDAERRNRRVGSLDATVLK